jgi:hypothetical protein
VTGSGATALRDALHLTLHLTLLLEPAPGARPVVLLFTDGRDTASWLSDEEILESLRHSDVVVHVIDAGDRRARQSLADRIAEASGGRVWPADSERALRRLFTEALDEMRARYLLTYAPEGVSHEGWHALKVGVRGGGDVTARPGYFASSAK